MARPKKDNADYFSHDSDMRNDPKIKALRKNFGFMGYAVWCYLLEFLTDSDHFEIEWNELNIELLSGDFDCETKDLISIVDYCNKINLLVIENDKLYSFQHKKRFDSLLSKRKRDRNRVIDSENPQSKVKYSKVNNSSIKTVTSATEIMKLLNLLSKDKIQEMKEISSFSGNLEQLKQKFSIEFIGRYGLNKTETEVLETFQSWMSRDKTFNKAKESPLNSLEIAAKKTAQKFK